VEAKSVTPALNAVDTEKLAALYADLRRESEISDGVPIAVRHIESLMRMAEASARMRLSPIVSDADVTVATRVMLESFISAQRFSAMRALRAKFTKYLDAGADYNQLCLVKLRDLFRERAAMAFVRAAHTDYDADADSVAVAEKDLRERAQRHGIDAAKGSDFLSSRVLTDAGYLHDKAKGVITRATVHA